MLSDFAVKQAVETSVIPCAGWGQGGHRCLMSRPPAAAPGSGQGPWFVPGVTRVLLQPGSVGRSSNQYLKLLVIPLNTL